MKTLILIVALFASQMTTTQDKAVVHLRPNRNTVDAAFGGKLLELINAPPIINLPPTAPKVDSAGNPWVVDIKNLGPTGTIVNGKGQFTAKVDVGQTVHISSNGATYLLRH